LRQVTDLLGQRVLDVVRESSGAEPAEHDEARLAFDLGRSGRLRLLPEDQIALPMVRHCAVVR
jgi:hypothetical protein